VKYLTYWEYRKEYFDYVRRKLETNEIVSSISIISFANLWKETDINNLSEKCIDDIEKAKKTTDEYFLSRECILLSKEQSEKYRVLL
jgi:hypothetical protein